MTVTFQLAGFLRSFAGGAREVRVDVPGRTVGDALRALAPALGAALLTVSEAAGIGVAADSTAVWFEKALSIRK